MLGRRNVRRSLPSESLRIKRSSRIQEPDEIGGNRHRRLPSVSCLRVPVPDTGNNNNRRRIINTCYENFWFDQGITACSISLNHLVLIYFDVSIRGKSQRFPLLRYLLLPRFGLLRVCHGRFCFYNDNSFKGYLLFGYNLSA